MTIVHAERPDFDDLTPRTPIDIHGGGSGFDMVAPEIDGYLSGVLSAAKKGAMILDYMHVGGEHDPNSKRREGYGSMLAAGFVLQAVAEGVHTIQLTANNPTVVRMVGNLAGDKRVHFYDRQQSDLELPMTVEQAMATSAHITVYGRIGDVFPEDHRDLNNPMIITEVDIADLNEDEYQRLVRAYTGEGMNSERE